MYSLSLLNLEHDWLMEVSLRGTCTLLSPTQISSLCSFLLVHFIDVVLKLKLLLLLLMLVMLLFHSIFFASFLGTIILSYSSISLTAAGLTDRCILSSCIVCFLVDVARVVTDSAKNLLFSVLRLSFIVVVFTTF